MAEWVGTTFWFCEGKLCIKINVTSWSNRKKIVPFLNRCWQKKWLNEEFLIIIWRIRKIRKDITHNGNTVFYFYEKSNNCKKLNKGLHALEHFFSVKRSFHWGSCYIGGRWNYLRKLPCIGNFIYIVLYF